MSSTFQFVDPRNDAAFRKIFGDQQHKVTLISFLNAVLGLEGERAIEDLTISSGSLSPLARELKESLLDIRATDKRGITFIVEMQLAKRAGIDKRVLYYSSKAYVAQVSKAEDYPKLGQVIFIGIFDFNMFEGPDWLTRHLILNLATQKQELKDLEFNFIELPKFHKTEEELTSPAEKWVYFLKNAPDLKMVPPHAQELGLIEAYELAKQHNWSREEMEYYDRRSMEHVNYELEFGYAQQLGRKEGLEAGRQVGLQEGLELGALIGKIQFGQQLLGFEATPAEMLRQKTAEELAWTLSELERQIRGGAPGFQT